MKSLKAKSFCALLVLAALNVTAAVILFRSAAAQGSDSIQINLAGAQRMLSQKMTKEAFLVLRRGDPSSLQKSIVRFDRVLLGLTEGNADLLLPGTRDPEVLAGLGAVRQTWAPIRKALEQIVANPAKADAALAVVMAGNMPLLTQMDAVVKLLEQGANDKVDATLRLQVGITASLIALLFVAWIIVLRKVIRPLVNTVDYVAIVSAGDLTGRVDPALWNRGDEIGDLARAMQSMSSNLRTMIGEISGKTLVVLSSSSNLQANAAEMSSGSRNASDRAHSVAAAAEQMSVNVTSVAVGIEQTTTNLDQVAKATGGMTSTIGQIAVNSETARSISEQATRQATNVTEQIGRLGTAALEIGKVTETIMEISAQTNLLALNATIEAARAGAAGKGFAVVANEIKVLAQQAAAATDDIKTRIGAIQSASTDSIGEVGKISQIIGKVTDIVTDIAAAIDKQAGVTEIIARNISEASLGVRDANLRVAESSQVSRLIAVDIAAVDHVAGDMAANSEHVRTSAMELAAVSGQLQHTVARFRL
jgi:methyl-accepting chemotaxis protein